jgi:Rod binding domain-containing protein
LNVQLSPSAQLLLSSEAKDSQTKEPSNPAGETFHQALLASSSSSESGKLAGAAKQFEALIAGQVLKSVRDANQGGWLGDDDDQTGELTMEMGEQAFAQALADRGAFGIAKIVTGSLDRGQSKTASSGPASLSPRAHQSTDASN